jgi:hypothetical protein
VLRPGGRLLSQGVGEDSNVELYEVIAGPVPPGERRGPQRSKRLTGRHDHLPDHDRRGHSDLGVVDR